MKKNNYKNILGIETSCDDTAIGIVTSEKSILSNIVINHYIRQDTFFRSNYPNSRIITTCFNTQNIFIIIFFHQISKETKFLYKIDFNLNNANIN